MSLRPVHDDDLPAGVEQIDVRLIDREGNEAYVNLDFVLSDTVELIDRLQREGRTVLVHCHGAYSRTPTVAALWEPGFARPAWRRPWRTFWTCCRGRTRITAFALR